MDEFRAKNTEVIGCSTDSHFTHLAWINTPRKEGGLGELKYPLVADLNHQIAKDYGVLLENAGIALRLVVDGYIDVTYNIHTLHTLHLR